jgi:16S rRNA processing protein RimM
LISSLAKSPDNVGEVTRAMEKMVGLGRILGSYGIHGWVKVFSATQPRDNIFKYASWLLYRGTTYVDTYTVLTGRHHNKILIAQLAQCQDRDQAALLSGLDIMIPRHDLPDPAPDEIYWTDLEGLTVVTPDGVILGTVDYVFNTGANDVLVVQGERERLVPFVWDQVVERVDLSSKMMVVNWDPDF